MTTQATSDVIGKRAVLSESGHDSDPQWSQWYPIIVDTRELNGVLEYKLRFPSDEDYISGWWHEARHVIIKEGDFPIGRRNE